MCYIIGHIYGEKDSGKSIRDELFDLILVDYSNNKLLPFPSSFVL